MVDENGTPVSWAQLTERLRVPPGVPALVLRGDWDNRPPVAEPRHGTFQLTRMVDGQWLLEEPIGMPKLAGRSEAPSTSSDRRGPVRVGAEGWLREPAGMVASPLSWFPNPAETEALELPGRELIAGRGCTRLLVSYSRHSIQRVMLWLDTEWRLVLAATSYGQAQPGRPRFELRVTEVERATAGQVTRHSRLARETVSV
ncbi:hypothetical protein [Actinoplanes sp. NPDC089786]|uniref:hypothetical protein n=1 Tax=Actinoplanes sp. NPDC089786 TaxID=3155185 RepID=UPI00342A7C36